MCFLFLCWVQVIATKDSKCGFSSGMEKSNSNAAIAFHCMAKMRFGQFKTFAMRPFRSGMVTLNPWVQRQTIIDVLVVWMRKVKEELGPTRLEVDTFGYLWSNWKERNG